VLTPQAVAHTVQQAVEMASRELKQQPDKPKRLEGEAKRIKKELEQFMRLISDGKAEAAANAPSAGPGRNPQDGERLGRFKDLLLADVACSTSGTTQAPARAAAHHSDHGRRPQDP